MSLNSQNSNSQSMFFCFRAVTLIVQCGDLPESGAVVGVTPASAAVVDEWSVSVKLMSYHGPTGTSTVAI